MHNIQNASKQSAHLQGKVNISKSPNELFGKVPIAVEQWPWHCAAKLEVMGLIPAAAF